MTAKYNTVEKNDCFGSVTGDLSHGSGFYSRKHGYTSIEHNSSLKQHFKPK